MCVVGGVFVRGPPDGILRSGDLRGEGDGRRVGIDGFREGEGGGEVDGAHEGGRVIEEGGVVDGPDLPTTGYEGFFVVNCDWVGGQRGGG